MRVAFATGPLPYRDFRFARLRSWAERFRAAGDEVVLFWVSPKKPPEEVAADWPSLRWVDTDPGKTRESWGGGWETYPSARLEAALCHGEIDLGFLPADGGLAFLPLQAQTTRVSLRSTALAVYVDELCLQARRRCGDLADDPWRELRLDWAERRAIELAPKLLLGNGEVERWLIENECRGGAEAVAVETFDWRAFVASERSRLEGGGAVQPFVSVCVPYRNQPEYLPEALASLAANEYPSFEVVVVDDGSDRPEARAVWEAEREKYPCWRFERIGWSGPGAARNAAARIARGGVLLFFDSDNVAKPYLVETLVGCLSRSGLDVVNCHNSGFGVPGCPYPINDFTPLGPALPLALVGNHCGDSVMAVHRRAFEGLGGFPESREVDYEDWEFWARVIAAKLRWEVVPRSLYWYRFTPHSRCYQVKVGFGLGPIFAALEPVIGRQSIRLARDLAAPLRYRNSALETERGLLRAEYEALVRELGERSEAFVRELRGQSEAFALERGGLIAERNGLRVELESVRNGNEALVMQLNRPAHVAAHKIGELLARVPRLRGFGLFLLRRLVRGYRVFFPRREGGST